MVLGAAGSGGPQLAHAFGAHSRVHGFDDGGLLDLLLHDPDAASRPGYAAPRSLDPRTLQLETRGITAVSPQERAAALAELAEQSSRESSVRGEAAAQVFLRLAEERARAVGKERFAVHVAGGAARVESLAEVFPTALFVHLVRDPRVVTAGDPEAAGAWLGEVVPLLRIEADHPERIVKLAYEELLTAPEAAFVQLCRSADLPPEPEPMAQALESVLREEDRRTFFAAGPDLEQIVELERVLQPFLSLLGFRPATPGEDVIGDRDQLSAEADEEVARGAEALAGEVVRLRHQARYYEGQVQELQRRLVLDAQHPPDLATLRWKAKRYDQIRVMVSPLRALRRLRSRFSS